MSYFIAHLNNGESISEQKMIGIIDPKYRRSVWDWMRETGKLEKISSLELKLPYGDLVNIPKKEEHWQFFQFKHAQSAPQKGYSHKRLSQIIGAVFNKQGDCIIIAYLSDSPDVIVSIDNVLKLKLFRIGAINLRLHNIKIG